MKLLRVIALAVAIYGGLAAPVYAADPLADRIQALEPIIGAHPPNIANKKEWQAVNKRYRVLKTELDQQLAASPHDLNARFLRGRLQSMGHNFDYPGAWEGATHDLQAVLKAEPEHIPALLALAKLWVNSDPALAPEAEKKFRQAQCLSGQMPVEEAQRGLFFAFYYQGKIKEALQQANYLTATWPQTAQYAELANMSRSVLKRTGGHAETTPPTMTTCDQAH